MGDSFIDYEAVLEALQTQGSGLLSIPVKRLLLLLLSLLPALSVVNVHPFVLVLHGLRLRSLRLPFRLKDLEMHSQNPVCLLDPLQESVFLPGDDNLID